MKFLCVKKCFWNNTLYEKGDTVDLDGKVKVPEHFKPCGTPQHEEQGRSGKEQGTVKKAKGCVKDKK